MAVSAKDVMELRRQTDCGMMECKKALVKADGDINKAIEILREEGLATAAKKAGRIAAEGMVYAVATANGAVVLKSTLRPTLLPRTISSLSSPKIWLMLLLSRSPLMLRL